MEPANGPTERPRVTLEDGTVIEAELIVGSDGANSMTRREHKIRSTGYSYNQNGLVCTVETLQPSTTAYQRFLRTGPVAMLPLWGNYSSIVWSCPPERSKSLKDLSDEAFCDFLNEVFHKESDVPWLGGITP